MEFLGALLFFCIALAAFFNLVTFIEELSEVRSGTRAGSRLRTVALLLLSAWLFGFGLLRTFIAPGHGGELIGVPMLAASGLGGLALALRLRRHFRR